MNKNVKKIVISLIALTIWGGALQNKASATQQISEFEKNNTVILQEFKEFKENHSLNSSGVIEKNAKRNILGNKIDTKVNATEVKLNDFLGWTITNSDAKWIKFNVNQRGILGFVMTRAIMSNGNEGQFDLELYNSNNVNILTADTSSDIAIDPDLHFYQIGLDKGTYYMKISPQFNISNGYIDMGLVVMFQESSFIEIEPNNTNETATSMLLNNFYEGLQHESSVDTAEDKFTFKLDKKSNIQVKIREEDGKTFSNFMYDSNGKIIADLERGFTLENGYKVYNFNNMNAGKYYIEMYSVDELAYYQLMVFTDKHGWINESGNWYYYNASSQLSQGWQKIDGTYYYFDIESKIMRTGWVLDGGKYYFLDKSGAMKTGWILDGGKYYYLENSGAMKKGWLLENGSYYYLENSGAMKVGWLLENGTYYHLASSGKMDKGWKFIDGQWYYFYNSGAMAKNTVIDGWRIDGNGVARKL